MASIEISSSLLYLVFDFYRYLLLYLFYVGSLLDVFYVFFFSLVTRILVFFLSYFIFLVTSIWNAGLLDTHMLVLWTSKMFLFPAKYFLI